MLDVSMLDTTLTWNATAAARYLAGGDLSRQEDGLLNGGSIYGYYRTEDDRHLAVGSLEPKFWRARCIAIERPDLIDAGRDATPAAQAWLKGELTAEFGARPLAEWQQIFATVDACVEPVLAWDEVCRHPQVTGRESIVDVPRPSGGTQRQIGHPVRFSATPPVYKHTGATPGEHTAEIMAALGYRRQRIEAPAEEGLFGSNWIDRG